MTQKTDITIVGAGPYGLSIGSYLHERRADFRIFGSPMHFWLNNMPKGMLLKSPGFASSLYDPNRRFTLKNYCASKRIPYQDIDLPVSLEVFCAYAKAFQQELVPNLEDKQVTSVTTAGDDFEVCLQDGEHFRSRKVVLAAGINYFRRIPIQLTHLPAASYSHSADHANLDKFSGKTVAVLGGGSSAIDTAVLLHEAGAQTTLISRRTKLNFGVLWGGSARPLLDQLKAPISPVGPGWSARMCTDAPWLYRYLPENIRLHIVKTALGPAPGWFMKDRAKVVPSCLGTHLVEAQHVNGSVKLRLHGINEKQTTITVDHVISATGYESDVRQLPFLSQEIVSALTLTGKTPRLSGHFESTVPGLYFVGPVAANNFGPVMRFAVGADFTSLNLANHLATLFQPNAVVA